MTEFNGSETVRLKHDHPGDGLSAGDCGIIWGVYALTPTVYEATFFNQTGEGVDMMFLHDEAELVNDDEDTPFPNAVREARRLLHSAGTAASF